MSQWTHVNGSIRIDAIRISGFPELDKSIFGKQSQWEDDFESKNIPTGSEGSLTWLLWENPSKSSMAAYTLNIFGDLRDYDDEQGILDYLNQITKDQIIRGGICEIDIEYKEKIVYQFNTNIEIWEKLSK